MELRVLNYFLMVAREENITRAANLLHMTQPTLSRQLMQLEEELGVKLFERSSHNIILTEEGMLLKRRAKEMISLADKTKQELKKNEDIMIGEISIGSGELNAMGLLSEIMCNFRKKQSQIQFDIYSGNADGIKERLENGLLDFGLLLEPVDIGKYEFVRMPVKDEWGVMVKKDSFLAEKKYIRPEDLNQISLIAPKRNLVRNELSSWLGDYEDSINVIATYSLMYNATRMVNAGVADAMLCIKLEAEYENLCFVPLSPRLELSSVLVWKKNQIFAPAVSGFINYAKNYINNSAEFL